MRQFLIYYEREKHGFLQQGMIDAPDIRQAIDRFRDQLPVGAILAIIEQGETIDENP